jgi:hypothetical protein
MDVRPDNGNPVKITEMINAPAYDMAISLLQKSTDPVSDILRTSAYWIPLQFVYVQMVKNKDLQPWSDLPKETRMEHWRMTDRDWPQWKRITLCQSIYVWNNLNEK